MAVAEHVGKFHTLQTGERWTCCHGCLLALLRRDCVFRTIPEVGQSGHFPMVDARGFTCNTFGFFAGHCSQLGTPLESVRAAVRVQADLDLVLAPDVHWLGAAMGNLAPKSP